MENRVEIHWAYPDSVTDQDASTLSEKEQLQSKAFRFEKHRKLYLASHHFLRQILSYHEPLSPSEWKYDYNQFGKPFISNVMCKPILFNLSHTEGMIVCAISRTHETGVDIERVRPLNKIADMKRYCLHEMERLEVDSKRTKQDKERLFFTYWTLKEAALKALGSGLNTPLHSLHLTNSSENRWKLNFITPSPRQPKNLQLRTFQLEKSYQLAIATHSAQALSANQELTVSITDSNSSDSSCWNSAVFTS
jgi:4'-phosphopantetheinyl transferase